MKQKYWKALLEIPAFMHRPSSLPRGSHRSYSCGYIQRIELWLTQIEGETIEEAGVIKMDFLGLKTLSILKTALQLIKQNHGD